MKHTCYHDTTGSIQSFDAKRNSSREISLDLVSEFLPRKAYIQRRMYESMMKVDFDTIGSKDSRSQPRPPFRIVSVIVTNNDPAVRSVVDICQNISAESLVDTGRIQNQGEATMVEI